MKRAISAAIVVALFFGACTSDGGEAPEQDQPSAERAEEEKPPRPPKMVAAKRVTSDLNLKHIRGCLYDEPVDIDSLAGQYYGPTDLVAGEVELVRDIDFTLPGDIKMVQKEEFVRELTSNKVRLSRKQEKVNRWLEWNLGYRPFSRRAEPSGKGAELVAGFYRPRSEEIVVHQEGEMDAEYIVLAHELAHAAVDQRFGLKDKTSPLAIDDKELAYAALVEGDATLTEFRLESRLGKRKQVDKVIDAMMTSKALFKKERAKGVPHAAIERHIFPYRWGAMFACSVFKKKGWNGVDRAHARPPLSTAEIMFPERFLKGEGPKKPDGVKAPPKRWKEFASGTIGAAHLKMLFEAPGDREHRALNNALGRAASWAGGKYKLWAAKVGSVDSILGMSFVEHKKHEGVLCSSMLKWYQASFNFPDRKVVADDVVAYEDSLRTGLIDCRGRAVKVVVAPELEQGLAMLGL